MSASVQIDPALDRLRRLVCEKRPPLPKIPRSVERTKRELVGDQSPSLRRSLLEFLERKRCSHGIQSCILWNEISPLIFRAPSDNSPFSYSEIKGARDTTPLPRTVEWREQFCEWADARLDVRPEKDGPAFIPAIFKPEGRRCDADVLKVTAAVLDFDGLNEPQTNRVMFKLMTMGLDASFLAYSTYSQGPMAGAHYRVVLPYEVPLSIEEHSRVYAALLRYFDGLADASCRNPSHLFYLPAMENWNAVRLYWRVYTEDQAERFLCDVSSGLAEGPSDDLGKLISEGMTPAFDGDRSRAVAAVTCSLIKEGKSDEEIAAVVTDPKNGISERPLEIGHARTMQDIQRLRAKMEGATPPKPPLLITQCLADIEPEPIRWLWRGRFPLGKLSQLVGHPGLGKSQVLASIAAAVTTGAPWPDGSPNTSQGSVIVITVEDDAADTLRPRYEAAGADLTRVHFVKAVLSAPTTERTFNLRIDLNALERAIEEIGNVRLVIIDPLTSFIPGLDPNKTVDVRGVLDPLNQLAARRNTAIVGVLHLNKGEHGRAIEKVSGSMAFVATVRASFLIEIDRDDRDRRFFLPLKFNVAKEPAGLAFRIVGVTLTGGIETSRIAWEAEAVVGVSADEALMGDELHEQRSALDEACDFLMRELDERSLPYKELEKAAELAGIAIRTIRRAQKRLGIKPHKDGPSGPWVWTLPPSATQGGQDGQDS